MKKSLSSILIISALLTACASTNSHRIAADARPALGKITDKQTIQQYQQRRASPVDVNVGLGGFGGHLGWGVSLGLAQLLNIGSVSSPEVMYRYTVQLSPAETTVVQTTDAFNLNDCVTVWQRATDATYPRLRLNSSCVLPQPQ